MRAIRRLAAVGAVLFALGPFAASAWGAPGDPLFVFAPSLGGYFSGPCGLGVDSAGRFYVSDYYHHAIDIRSGDDPAYLSEPEKAKSGLLAKLTDVDPLDGPCGLALDSANRLYVNSFDRGVIRYGAYPSFGAPVAIAGAGVDATHPTGVAVNLATDDVYVNDRTYITAYDSSGVRLTDGPDPLQIGLGSLGEGYGLAIDAGGHLYAADAADDTVKVYDPATDKVNPVLTINGPPGGFSSLRHGALAVDRARNRLYVVDNLQPFYTEQPAAQVDVFDLTGAYLGVLKHRIVDALPAGIAVDQASGGVYVTSGNTVLAGIYSYPTGSQVPFSLPPTVGRVGTSGSLAPPSPATAAPIAATATAITTTTTESADETRDSPVHPYARLHCRPHRLRWGRGEHHQRRPECRRRAADQLSAQAGLKGARPGSEDERGRR